MKHTNKREEEGNERPFPYQAIIQFIVWEMKKEKAERTRKKGARREPVLCPAEHTDVPLGSSAVLGRTGFLQT